jgi:hypothetical protein
MMGPMEAFIHRETLIIFKKYLADPEITSERRQMILRLLAREKAREFSNGRSVPAADMVSLEPTTLCRGRQGGIF